MENTFNLKKFLVENKLTYNSRLLAEAVEVPEWLKGKLADVHSKPGQGSIFAKPIDTVMKTVQQVVDGAKNVDQVANSTGTLTVSSPGIGYNLVLPMAQALKLPGAKQGEVEKVEGPNKVKVPSVTTTAPLSQFASDELTVIVRPKKDEAGAVIPNEYIVLSAFPGDPDIPRASEWGDKFAVIIPGGEQQQESSINESILGVIALGATIGMGWNWITKKKKQLDKASAIADRIKGREDEKKEEEAKIAAQEAALAQVETFLKDPKNQEVINKIKNDPDIKTMTAELDQDYNKEYDSWERSGGQGMFSQGPSPWWGMGKESVVKQIEAKMKELGGEQLINLLATSGQGIRGLK